METMEMIPYLKSWIGMMHPRLSVPLLEKGEHFIGREPVNNNPVTKVWAKRNRPKPKRCYNNAQLFALDHPEAKYYEGYWSAFVIPVHHGWVVLDGKVIDFTAEAGERSLKRRGIKHHGNPTTEEYFGVHIPTEFIRESILETKMWTDLMAKYLIS